MGNAPTEGFSLDNYQYQEDKVDFHLGQIRIFVNQLNGENICIIEKMIQDVNYKFRKLEHPAILQILYVNQTQKQGIMYQFYTIIDCLRNILHRQKKRISYNEDQLWGIMKPVIDSYIYLKQYDIYPMDVKSILISSQGTIKLHSIYEKNLSYYMQFLSGLQDQIFLSPEEIKFYKKKELILNLDFEKCQIFQLGLILLFAASLTSINQLFSQDTLEFQESLAQQSIQSLAYSNDFKKVISKMLNANPNQRGNYFEYQDQVQKNKCNPNVIYIEETSNQQTPRKDISQQMIIKQENTQINKQINKQEIKQENKIENKKVNNQENIKFDNYIQPQQFSSLNQGQSYEYYSIQRPQPQQLNSSLYQSNQQQFYKADKIQNFSIQNTDLRQTVNAQQQQNPTLQISTISPQQSQVQQSINQQNTLQQFNQNLATTFNPYQLNLPQQNIQQIKLPIQQIYQNANPQQDISSRRGSIRNQLQSSSKPKIPQQFAASSGEQSQRILSSSRLQYQNQYQNYNQPYLNQQYSNQLDSKVEQVLKEAQNTIRKFDEVNLKLSSFSAPKGLPSRTSSVSSKNVTSDQNLNRILNRANYEVQRSKQ